MPYANISNTHQIVGISSSQRRIQGGGAIEAKPPGPVKFLLISGGFHAPTGAEPPLERKKCKPPRTNSWIRPWICSWTNLRVISNKFQLDRKLWLKIQFQVFTSLSIILPDIKKIWMIHWYNKWFLRHKWIFKVKCWHF